MSFRFFIILVLIFMFGWLLKALSIEHRRVEFMDKLESIKRDITLSKSKRKLNG